VGARNIPNILVPGFRLFLESGPSGRTWKNAEVGEESACKHSRSRGEGVGVDLGSAGNNVMKGLAWEKEDVLTVWVGEIGEGLNPDARFVSVLDPDIGEVGFRDPIDFNDHSVVRGSLEGSGHGRRWEDIGVDGLQRKKPGGRSRG